MPPFEGSLGDGAGRVTVVVVALGIAFGIGGVCSTVVGGLAGPASTVVVGAA